MKKKKLVILTSLVCAIAQVNASMMEYNTSNQMIRVDKQSMLYSPEGYLASVDNINILHAGGTIIEQQGSMVTTIFGGVRLISNGVAQTIFTDNHSTLKTTSSDKNQRSYTDPYGNPIQKDAKESYPLEHNRLTFDGGYKINKDITNFNARNYILSLKVFSSMDSSNVANRYNFSDGNPIMKFDPSGHNAEGILNFIGNMTIGFDVGTILLDKDSDKVDKAVLTGLKYLSLGIFLGLTGKFFYDSFFVSSDEYLNNEINKSKIKTKETFTSTLQVTDDSNLTEDELKNKKNLGGDNVYSPIGGGTFGDAYHNKDTGYVYKVYNNEAENNVTTDPSETLAQRNARKMIQANKGTPFANDIKAVGKDNHILRTPFVNNVITEINDDYFLGKETIDRRLHNNGMFMMDIYSGGNIGIYEKDYEKYYVILDSDQVVDSPYRPTNSTYSKKQWSREIFKNKRITNKAITHYGDRQKGNDPFLSRRIKELQDNFNEYTPEETKYYA